MLPHSRLNTGRTFRRLKVEAEAQHLTPCSLLHPLDFLVTTGALQGHARPSMPKVLAADSFC